MCFLSNLRQRRSRGHLLFLLFFVAKKHVGTGPVSCGDRPLGTPVFLLTPTAGKKGFARFSRAKDSPRHVFSKQPSAEVV